MRDYRSAATSGVERGTAGDDALAPGKRTLTEALPVQRAVEAKTYEAPPQGKADSARFAGDKTMEDVAAGSTTVKQGDRGVEVTKVQQALIDLGYLLPVHGVDGKFEGETKAAVLKFQNDHGLPPT